jgi:hypothetical protein
MTRYFQTPLAILIFRDHNDQIFYRAYSPHEFIRTDNPDVNSEAIGQFIANIYNRISLDTNNPLNNQTNLGKLLEIHIRSVDMPPVEERGNIAYFSTYDNQHCNYRPIHRPSPIVFNANQATDYAQQQPELYHNQAEHEII